MAPPVVKSELKAELGVHDDWLIVTSGSDTTTYSPPLRALRANTSGVIKVDTLTKTGVLMNFAAGETRYGKFVKVYATGTTVAGVIEAGT